MEGEKEKDGKQSFPSFSFHWYAFVLYFSPVYRSLKEEIVVDIRNYVLFIVVIFSTLLWVGSWVNSPRASEFARLEGNTIIFEERKETRQVSNVPKGLTLEQAAGLVDGDIPLVRIEGIAETKTTSIFPLLSKVSTTEVRVVTYESGWQEVTSTESVTEQDLLATIFMWMLPLLLMVMAMSTESPSATANGLLLAVMIGVTVGLIVFFDWILLNFVWPVISSIIWTVYGLVRKYQGNKVLLIAFFLLLTQFHFILIYINNEYLSMQYGAAVAAMLVVASVISYGRVWAKRASKVAV